MALLTDSIDDCIWCAYLSLTVRHVEGMGEGLSGVCGFFSLKLEKDYSKQRDLEISS